VSRARKGEKKEGTGRGRKGEREGRWGRKGRGRKEEREGREPDPLPTPSRWCPSA
jgi:hypothetical protein